MCFRASLMLSLERESLFFSTNCLTAFLSVLAQSLKAQPMALRMKNSVSCALFRHRLKRRSASVLPF